MKIYVSKINESWIVDRFRDEWIKNNSQINTPFAFKADVIWLIAPWVWRNISKKILTNKKVVCTIHHLEDGDFENDKREEFFERDKYVDVYHVISKKTKNELEQYTKKPITYIPFWSNNKIFYEIKNKKKLRKELNISENAFVIGSFQRDTEGKDLKSPKLIKGPDRLLEIFEHYNKTKNELLIVLSGKRRQYITSELVKRNINYKYFEMVDFVVLNELYNILDLYIVSSRIEGGQRSVFECAQIETPIISTDVGFASEILAEESVYSFENHLKARPNIEYAKKNVSNFLIPEGFQYYLNMFNEVYES